MVLTRSRKLLGKAGAIAPAPPSNLMESGGGGLADRAAEICRLESCQCVLKD